MHSISAISPVDGRYHDKTRELIPYFSEKALFHYRLRVEIEYFIALCKIPLPQLQDFPVGKFDLLRNIYRDFDESKALKIKEIERITNHDIKAVEYYIKEQFDEAGIAVYKEFIHFGLTSQDINNTAIPLSIKEFMENVYLGQIKILRDKLEALSKEWESISMLAYTHGQPASPTKLGKEMKVYVRRLDEQIRLLSTIPHAAKFGGATGQYNAHKVAYPEVDWPGFARDFVTDTLELYHSYPTTQIEHYDHLAALFDNMKRINTILLDFSRDIWSYVSMHYFTQKIKKGEVGSSAMPHKVNPIDFENAEGNLGIANALWEHLSAKLPVSRLQRDLTDSTVLRNTGVPFAHSLIAFKSLLKGLDKLIPDRDKIEADLQANWAVVAEAIQNILRREGYPKPYEALKDLTRTGEAITRKTIENFIDRLEVPRKIKEELKEITPDNYTGYA